jgi:hypothetical protein
LGTLRSTPIGLRLCDVGRHKGERRKEGEKGSLSIERATERQRDRETERERERDNKETHAEMPGKTNTRRDVS